MMRACLSRLAVSHISHRRADHSPLGVSGILVYHTRYLTVQLISTRTNRGGVRLRQARLPVPPKWEIQCYNGTMNDSNFPVLSPSEAASPVRQLPTSVKGTVKPVKAQRRSLRGYDSYASTLALRPMVLASSAQFSMCRTFLVITVPPLRRAAETTISASARWGLASTSP